MRYDYRTGSKPKKPNVPKKEQGVIYVRVSSKEQEEEGFSIPAQKRLLEDHAKKVGLTIASTFEDMETAKKSGRKDFLRMLQYLGEHPEIQHILVEKTDRLYRNFRDYVDLDDLGRDIHLVKEGEILNRDSHSHQKFIHGIKVLMAKNYIDNLSEEVTKGMKEKARNGEFPTKPPAGYLVDHENKQIVLDLKRAPIIRKAFEFYATGQYSLSDLRKWMIEQGYTQRESERKPYKSSIDNLLKNPFYYGSFRWAGKIYPGKHPALITKDLFDRVQLLLDGKGPGDYQERKFAFTNLVTCGYCGCAITAEIKKEKYVYYHCTQTKGKCTQKYIREDRLSVELGKALEGIKLDPRFVAWVKTALNESGEEEQRYHQEETIRLQDEILRLGRRIEQIYVDRLDGKVAEEFWEAKSGDWKREKERAENLLHGHQQADRSYREMADEILELAQSAHSLYQGQTPDQQRELLNHVTSNFFLRDGEVTPEYRKPFDLLAFAAKEFIGENADSGPEDPKSAIRWAVQDSNL